MHDPCSPKICSFFLIGRILRHGILNLAAVAGCILEVEHLALVSANEGVSFFFAILLIRPVSLPDSAHKVEFIHVLEETLDDLEVVFDVEIGSQVSDLSDVADLGVAVH